MTERQSVRRRPRRRRRFRMPTPAQMRKAIGAAAAMAALLTAQGLLSGQAENIVTGVLAAADVGLVYWLRNDRMPPPPERV